MALTRRADGTGAANRVTAAWWNDFMDLFTGVMTDQPVTFGNTLRANGNTTLAAKAWVNPQTSYGSSFPGISLAIGDNDTGFNWVGDGHLQLVVNNSVWGDWQPNKGMQFVVLDNGVPKLIRIHIGTNPPTSPGEGDIWIKG